jgi:hypothetical protein
MGVLVEDVEGTVILNSWEFDLVHIFKIIILIDF